MVSQNVRFKPVDEEIEWIEGLPGLANLQLPDSHRPQNSKPPGSDGVLKQNPNRNALGGIENAPVRPGVIDAEAVI